MSWTAERVDRVRTLAALPEKLSAAEIAGKIGVSRNAVIGICQRRGIHLPNLRGQYKSHRRQAPKPALTTPEFTPRKADTKPLLIPFAKLEPHHCRYPFGEQDFTYCGRRKQGESPYCPAHARLCYPRAIIK